MSFRSAALICLCGLSACNQENTRPAQEPELTPASYDAREESRSATPAAAANPAPASQASDPAPVNPPAPNTDATRANPPAAATDPARSGDPASPAAPDNTKVNERDRNTGNLTPGDQNNNETDLKITQQIRQAVMADGSLSFTAKNVKIITQNGKVTLRGPVNTAQERSAIEAAARKVAGATQVDNQIEVKK